MTGGAIEELLRLALREDLDEADDLTTNATIRPDAIGSAVAVARESGVVSGLEPFATMFALVDARVAVDFHVRDGDVVSAGRRLATVRGPLRAILTSERTALNLLCRLSGVATATRHYVETIAGTRARIRDTRKTTPGMRALEKAAVRHGGGTNHRFGLYDAALIKDNHVAAAGGVAAAVRSVREGVAPGVHVQVEIDSLDQLGDALASGADSILLDNFSAQAVREAVERTAGRVPLEASGGINDRNARDIAETGVDFISIGALTHSAKALDIGLDMVVD